MESNNKIRREISKGPLTVSRVYKSDFQKKKTITAELKQVVKTISFYPKTVINDSLTGKLFDIKDFGIEEESYASNETRVAWVDVPEKHTLESVKKKIASYPKAGLYRILSNSPILSESQTHAIENDELDTDIDTFANKQIIRVPEGAEENAGEIALDTNHKVQYRRILFNSQVTEDIDRRTKDPEDYYASEEIVAELNNVDVFETEEQFL